MQHNKKLMTAGFVVVLTLGALGALSYTKELSEHGPLFGGSSQAPISRNNPAGTYVAFVRGADTAGRTVVLQLGADAERTATMTADYNNVQSPIVDRGTWSATPDGFSLVLTSKNNLTLGTPEVLNFSIEKKLIRLINADRVTWGSYGLTLVRSPLELPSEWVWISTTIADGSVIVARTKTPFAMRLSGENRVNIQGDCNVMNGTFGLRRNNGIVFSALASNRMYCEGSQEDVFAQDVARSIEYRVEGNILKLILPENSGFMTFEKRTIL